MKYLFVLFVLLVGNEIKANKALFKDSLDVLQQSIARPSKSEPYFLERNPKVIFPAKFNLPDVSGKAIASVWIDENGEVEWNALLFLSLYDKNSNECFIKYRAHIALFDFVDLEHYPLPIQPFVVFLKDITLTLDFKENKSAHKQKFLYIITYDIDSSLDPY